MQFQNSLHTFTNPNIHFTHVTNHPINANHPIDANQQGIRVNRFQTMQNDPNPIRFHDSLYKVHDPPQRKVVERLRDKAVHPAPKASHVGQRPWATVRMDPNRESIGESIDESIDGSINESGNESINA